MSSRLFVALLCGAAAFGPSGFAEDDSLDRDYAGELTRPAPVEPAKVQDTFAVHPDFRMDLVASEPLIRDPIAMAFDADGRLFVVEMTGYSEERETIPCTIRLLEDSDGDGAYDKQTPYVEGLEWAVAVACYDGGVFIGVPPNILYAKDNDGDGRADTVETVYTGFALSNVQGLMNTFLWGLDNRIHGATSASGGNVSRPDQPDMAPVPVGGRDFSFDPRTRDFRAESGGAQHGKTCDDYGSNFVCSNSDHLQWVWYEDRYAARNPHFAPPSPRESIAADGAAAEVFRTSPVEGWREVRTRLRVKGLVPGPIEGGGRASGYFTSATGVTVYRGDEWPAAYRGNVFIADVGSNLIHRKRIVTDGLNLSGVRADEGREFITSCDNWFRPVQFANAPDGCLYTTDMYREVIEHPDSLPPIIKKHLDLNSGNDRGRIYRIAPKDFSPRVPPKLSQYTSADLVPLLAHANAWHAETASRLLYERQDTSVVPALMAFAKDCPEELGRTRALYALDGLAALDEPVLVAALQDASPVVRAHALRLSETHFDSYAVRAEVLKRAEDADPWVRLQAAWTLGFAPDEERLGALAGIAKANAGEQRIRAAVLCSAASVAGRLTELLAADTDFTASDAAAEWLPDLAKMAGAFAQPSEAAAVLAAVEGVTKAHPVLAKRMLLSLHEAGPVAGGAKGGAADLMAELVKEAMTTVPDESADAEARAQAVRVLQTAPEDEARPVLLALLTPQTPDEVQAAAIDALGRMSHADVSAALIGAWSGLSPARRAQAIEVLFRRVESLRAVLAAIKEGQLPARDIDSTRVHALLTHPDAALRAEAEALLKPANASSREEIIAQYRKALELTGDATRGAAVFATNCTPCHQVHGQGNNVGPNLATVAQAGGEKILLNVLDPNRELNPQYVNYTVQTNDFETHTGIIVAETATNITLKRAHGETDVISRADIESIRSDALSIMPEGFETAISVEAMADLIAFLTSAE